jgi:uncharacterized protein
LISLVKKMEDVSIKLKKNIDISNSLVILGFPTIGLIGSIAGNYISNSLNLERVGSINSKYFMPSVIIRDSKPIPPVRIYHADQKMCGENNLCDNLVTIVSDFPITPQIVNPLIEKILAWTDESNISLFLGLEGLKSTQKEEDKVDVYGVGSNSKMVEILDNYKIEKIKNGILAGFTGAFLSIETERNNDMLCMLTEAHLAYPDSRAAGRLLEKVNEMLPGVNLDLEPLYEEAEKIESNIKNFMKQSQQMPQADKSTLPEMYS